MLMHSSHFWQIAKGTSREKTQHVYYKGCQLNLLDFEYLIRIFTSKRSRS